MIKRNLALPYLGLLCGLLMGCSQFAFNGSTDASEAIVASPNDTREYRYLRLPNQMQVILIADPSADKAAASLSVSVGSGDDPQDREGLAHFLEHMLFLGTDQYPEPDEYQNFISSHGGRHNAYTAFDETNYFFDIDPDYLEPSLDRFSRFFVRPLFNPGYVEREKHAVHSEYTAKLKNDYRRQQDALRQVVNPDHPIAKFSVGNLDTLADRPGKTVRDDLLKFYHRHYSANRMNLVVQAPLTLTQLEEMVWARFSVVPDMARGRPQVTEPFFSAGQLPQQLNIKPEQEIRQLEFLFPLPSTHGLYRQKPLSYIGNLLGHEGPGSLLAELKRRGWADELSAGMALDDRNSAIFQVSISLTIEGMAHQQEIRQLLFSEVDLVRAQGVEDWRYTEQGELAAMQFRFQEPIPPAAYVRQLSSRLHRYPAVDVMRGPYSMEDYDASLIRSFLGYIRQDNVLVILVSPEAETDQVTRLYQVPYAVRSLEGSTVLASRLSLPAANPYVPEDFALKGIGGVVSDVPREVVSQPRYRVWHYQDQQFNVPRQQFYMAVKTPLVATPKGAALTDLYLALVNEKLMETSYAAALAGLGYGVNRRPDGFGVVVSGFNDKLPLLAEKVVQGLASLSWRDEDFERVRQQLIRSWRNVKKSPPYRQVWQEVAFVLQSEDSAPAQLAVELETVTPEELTQFVQVLFSGVSVEFLIGGNVQVSEAKALAQRVHSSLPISGVAEAELFRPVIRLDSVAAQEVVLSLDHDDSALMRYYQGRDDSLEEHARVLLLKQIIKAPFFNSLRTEQQLGYVVAAVDVPLERVPGLGLLVQSPVAMTAELESAVDQFLVDFREQIDTMSEEDFEQHRASVLTTLREKPKNLAEQMARFWGDIDLRYGRFDTREQLIQSVEEASQKSVQKAYSEWLLSLQYSLQVVTGDKPKAFVAEKPVEFVELPSSW